jgi:hypothetical protein
VVKESVLDVILYNLARKKDKQGVEWFRSLTAAPGMSGAALLALVSHVHVGVTSEDFICLSMICLNPIWDSSHMLVNHT